MFRESSMSLNDLYRSLCLSRGGDDVFELIVEHQSVIWGGAYDVVNAAMELTGHVQHEYTSKYDSPTLDSVLTINGTTLEISVNPEKGDNHEVMVGLSKLLDAYEVLFLSESNGCSDLAFVIDTKENARENRIKYGYEFYFNLVPVSELPDLWNTPVNQIDAAVENYAKHQGQQLTASSIKWRFFARIRKKIASLFRRQAWR
jgi:hypothetical protein